MDLTTIRFSHYNEKARWGLDWFEVPYVEHPYMPILHIPFALVASKGRGRKDAQSTRFSTPILRTPEGDVVTDSSDILHFVSDRFADEERSLFPNDEAAELERAWSRDLAPHTRLYGYFCGLADRALACELADRNVPARQAAIFKAFYPLWQAGIVRGLDVRPESAERSVRAIDEQWKRAEALLADGRPFFTADRFTAADLAFACAAAPALLVSPEEGFGAVLPPLRRASDDARKLAERCRATAAGRHALRCFREYRGRRVIPCEPLPLPPTPE